MEGINWAETLAPVTQAVALAIGSALFAALVQLARKYGIELRSEQQQAIKQAGITAVLAVEEQARRAVAQQMEAWTSAQKASRALQLASEEVPFASADDLRRAVDAALPTTGLGRASKPPGKAAPTP